MSLSLPSLILPQPPILSSYSPFSIGQVMRLNAGAPSAAVAWGTANQARYTPFYLTTRFVVAKLLVYCGTTSGAGNNDMGVYDANGNELISVAAAAHPGAAAWQEFDVTDTPLAPGLYYVGLLHTTTTGTFAAWTNKEYGRAAGVFSQAVGAATLPTPTATFAALDAAVVPVVGMSSRVLI